jgi:hypothetical protein
MEIVARSDGGSLLRWTADILPEALAPFLQSMMEEGAAAISRRFAARAVQVAA